MENLPVVTNAFLTVVRFAYPNDLEKTKKNQVTLREHDKG